MARPADNDLSVRAGVTADGPRVVLIVGDGAVVVTMTIAKARELARALGQVALVADTDAQEPS